MSQAGNVIVRTSQARLYLDSRVGGVATLDIASLRVPILIELAEAQAKLDAISCAGGAANASGSIAIADINTSTLDNFETPVTENRALLAHALLLDVNAKAHVALGGVTWQTVAFSPSDIAGGVIHTVSTGDILQGVASSLMSNMDLRVALLGIGIDASAATQIVGAVIKPLSPALDGLVDQVTQLLGVHIGQTDLRVDGVRCGRPTLVA